MVLATTSGPVDTATLAPLGDLGALAVSWRRALRAQNKSPRTIVGYLEGVRFFEEYLARMGMPRDVANISREHVEMFIAEQLARFRPSTAKTRYRSLQQLFRFLVDDGELRISPMAKMSPPAVAEEPPAVLTDEQLRRLLKACEGTAFAQRRDLAIVRLLLDTGMRLAELTGLRVADLDLEADVAIVLGKGRRPRACPFGPRAAAALDRYLRARAAHHSTGSEKLWVGLRSSSTCRSGSS